MSTKQSLSTGISSSGLTGLINGAAGYESSSTFAGVSVNLKPNELMNLKRIIEPGTCENPLSDFEATSGRPNEYHLRH